MTISLEKNCFYLYSYEEQCKNTLHQTVKNPFVDKIASVQSAIALAYLPKDRNISFQ